MKQQNFILKRASVNTTETYMNNVSINRIVTRNKLIFTGSSAINIQLLYPLFSDLTYQNSYFKTVSTCSG